MKVCLIISYDGTNYNGWQKQNISQNGKMAIQNVVDDALTLVYKSKIETIGASRTDAGVHALNQVVIYDVNSTLPVEKIAIILNQKLPKDIRIMKSFQVDNDFHPRYMCKNKTYEYNIYCGETLNPLYRNFVLHKKETLNIDVMNEACKLLIGEHDFKGFSNVSDVKSTVREIYLCEFSQNKDFITFKICGSGFLYNMVRIIVATLMDIGTGRKDVSVIKEILTTGNRNLASATAKGHPLNLVDVKY